jgi:GNAT superfamily N-acetyltransferase
VGRVSLIVRRAAFKEILPLRHAVLRPGKPESASIWDRDDDAVHIGAWRDDALVGCATVFTDAWDGADGYPAEPTAWRLRGMAVDLSRQGGGIGRAVLAAAIEAARDAGAPLIWANARTTAIAFYESAGFVALGEGYLTAETRLPHKKIVLPLD